MSAVQLAGSVVGTAKDRYYTNKTIAGAAINAQVKVGYVMCGDYANTVPGQSVAESRNLAVTKPETANLNLFAGIVTSVAKLPTTSGGVVNGDAGWVALVSVAEQISAFTHANMAAHTTVLTVANGDWGLIASAGIASIGAIMGHVGVALETSDTSTTAANKFVALRGPGVGTA